MNRTGHRPEIQGLRAVAALLVAIYHIWLGRVSGGVDVFFVVSAFLITTSLLRQIERDGRVSFVVFWSGLAQRLVPLAMLVLFTVTVVSIVWLPQPLWHRTIQQIFAAAFYLENWQLAFNAVDYLAQGQAASPVQHYWALSLQGQFYFLWPIVFAAALFIAARLKARPKVVLWVIFAGIFCLSLAFSIIATSRNQAFTYFNTFARLWEFCLGAALAMSPSIALHRGVRVAFGWIGLLGIIACGILFQVSRVFPGYVALWPVGCAMLIMLAGSTGSRYAADRLLCSKPLVQLGDISYGVYLWHWPVLIFYRWFTHHDAISLIEGLGILAFSIALAAISAKFVENPMRYAKIQFTAFPRFAAFVVVLLCPVVVVASGWGAYYFKQREHDARSISLDHPDYPGARALLPGFRYVGQRDVPVYPGMLAVTNDLPPTYSDGCHRPDPDWQRVRCVYGNPKSTKTMAIVGGSHALHWLPAIKLIAEKQDWRVVVYTRSSCLFGQEIGVIQQEEWCEEYNDRVLQILLKDRPDVVFTTSTRGSGVEEHVPPGYLQRWEQLKSAGIEVVAVRDTPWMKFWVPECLEMKGHDSMECAQPKANVLALHDPVKRLKKWPENVQFIDMTEYFCSATLCFPVIGNVVVYRDDSHITATYAETLALPLSEKLAAALPSGWMKQGDRLAARR